MWKIFLTYNRVKTAVSRHYGIS